MNNKYDFIKVYYLKNRKMDSKRENMIVTLAEDFAVKIISFHAVVKQAGIDSMASQLFRSGTSIGANVMEAQNAESNKDFVHKMKIAAKEGEETEYWLRLCSRSELLPDPGSLSQEINSINKILTKIVSTAKKNLVAEKTDRALRSSANRLSTIR